MEILEGEIWVFIDGYDGQYKVSNLGRLMICFVKFRGGKRRYVNRILKPYINSRGYYKVDLSHVAFEIHRIIAKYFVPNPENKPMVNHKDHDKLNNLPSNLEWVTNRENTSHGLLKKKTISKYLGVCHNGDSRYCILKRWFGRTAVNGKTHRTPYFLTEDEAYIALEGLRKKLGVENKYAQTKRADGTPPAL